MIKKIYITNGSGTSGKDTFVQFVGKYIPAIKYSIIELPKIAARTLGWDGSKTEKDRKFLSDLLDLAAGYNDSPFNDVVALFMDFKTDKIVGDVMFVDMRDPRDIDRAKRKFGAETILIKNPHSEPILSNHADANVENYTYDYIIENDSTLEQLDKVARFFAKDVIGKEEIPDSHKPFTFVCSNY